MAGVGDAILIAGKGHETYQILGTVKHDFSDRKVVKDFFLKPKNEFSRAWLRIDREILRENLRLIHQDMPEGLKMLAVVKDNALGHGIVDVSREVVKAGCDYLGVAFVSEALRLRQAGIEKTPILVFGERADEALDTCIRHNLTLQVQSVKKARLIGRLSQNMNKVTKVHFKVDTGMGRYGVRFDQAVAVFEEMVNTPGIEIEGIMTHFAQSDELKKDYANLQWERFQQVLEPLKKKGILPPIVHACNTGGYLDLPHAHCDMVRTGILPFGVYPSKVCRRINLDGKELQPVMTVGAKIAFIKELEEGDFVGYGMHFQAKEKMKVAILPIGYGDGYPRLRNQGFVLICGQEAPIVGGNGMDGTMVDIRQIPEACIGDEVILLGKQGQEEITVRMLADWANTVTYDVMSRWTERIERYLV
ncbi:MAG: alanine racemase [SAR324 cluster bacterium]|uniref:Alanine racemase n=1 Tax=SAR324 cluster bacterium TaxID=2024889 RepID=A0A2A4T3C8_9DELT|nr:MAG: alanine racemase [SAR324 cluster bacterium]